jgi:signal peptidase II
MTSTNRSGAWARALTFAACVVALDQITKQLVASNIAPGDSVEIIFGIELSNVRNSGVAFGLLSGGAGLVVAFTLGTLALVVLYFLLHSERDGLWIAVGLLCGGALGNLADRLRDGSVIDFVNLPLWPAFNLADVAIVVGVGLLAGLLITAEGSGEAAR